MIMYRSPIVFDIGSYSTRIGFAKDLTPVRVFPTLTSKSENGDILIGPEVKENRGKKIIDFTVLNWDNFEALCSYCFEILKTKSEDSSLVSNNVAFPLKSYKEKLAQILFEEFNIPALHLAEQAVLSLYSHGHLNGTVLHSGMVETQVFPIYEGHILTNCLTRGLPIAGEHFTYSLMDYLSKQGYNVNYDTTKTIKEKFCYVAKNYEQEQASEDIYTLPDGNTLTLGQEKCRIPEELFTSFNELGIIQDKVISTICRCDPNLRNMLFTNIVLSGGNTLLPGFAKRLHKEIKINCPKHYKKNRIIAPNNRENSTWTGGAILASSPNFEHMCMTRNDYNEYGPNFVHTKFF